MIWLIGICCICLGVCMPMYIHYKRAMHLVLASSYKVAGTLCAFSAALIASIRLDPRCWVCAAAILIYASADFVLEFNFMLGAGLFLAGHICILSFFLNLVPISMIHLVCMLVLSGFCLLVFWHLRKPIGRKMPLFLVYGLSLSAMCASALGCFTASSAAGILIACGGALFCISDLIILRKLYFPPNRINDWIVMLTYYSAVLLFGIACIYI